MTGIHDPLLARALVLDDGNKTIALVGVDHLGYNSAMVQAVKKAVAGNPATARAGKSISDRLTRTPAGVRTWTFRAWVGSWPANLIRPSFNSTSKVRPEQSSPPPHRMEPAKVGIGYGKAQTLNRYRGNWPPNVKTLDDVAVIKVTRADGSPLGVFFNFAAHATVLSGSNLEFSADFVGYARKHTRGSDRRRRSLSLLQWSAGRRGPPGARQRRRISEMRRPGEGFG